MVKKLQNIVYTRERTPEGYEYDLAHEAPDVQDETVAQPQVFPTFQVGTISNAQPQSPPMEEGLARQLLGLGQERVQTWPERLLSSALTAPRAAYRGELPETEAVMEPNALGRIFGMDKRWSVPAPESMIGRAQDISAAAVTGPLTMRPGAATLGSGAVHPGIGDAAMNVTRDAAQGIIEKLMGKGGATPVEQVAPEAISFWEKTKQITPEEAKTLRRFKNIPDQIAPVFYSAVEHALSNAKQQSASPEQWAGYIRNQPGVKTEELQWMGLEDWLKSHKGQVTKAQIDDYVRSHKVELKEVKKEGVFEEDDLHDLALEQIDREYSLLMRNPQFAQRHPHIDDFLETPQGQELYNTIMDRAGEGGGTKYYEYQLPGGDNYRELLLTLPFKKAEPGKSIADQMPEFQRRHARPEAYAEDPQSVYRSAHWDEPNVLAHVRVNDRYLGGGKGEALDDGLTAAQVKDFDRWARMTLEQRQKAGVQEAYEKLLDQQDKWAAGWRPESKKTLFLEEVQSDWHQAGRKQGYKSEGKKAFPGAQEGSRFANVVEGVPDAPFKTTWPDLVLKRMIREAAENGYDQIAWTPGEVQAARYDLSKQIKDLRYEKTATGYNIGANKNPETWVEHHVGDNIPEAKLADYVGKDVAQKIIQGEGKDSEHGGKVLLGVDLKVGGEGMKSFYDKMLVDKANALAKKYGGKVETQALGQYDVVPARSYQAHMGPGFEVLDKSDNHHGFFPTREAADQWVKDHDKVWVLPITPKMKEAALGKGFPLFSSGLPFQFEPVDHDPFKKQGNITLEPVDHDPFATWDPNRT